MLTRNIRDDVLIYLAFWALYGPLAIAMWRYGDMSLIGLAILLFTGLVAILAYLLVDRMRARKRKQKIVLARKAVVQKKYDELTGFRELFSENKVFGGGTT